MTSRSQRGKACMRVGADGFGSSEGRVSPLGPDLWAGLKPSHWAEERVTGMAGGHPEMQRAWHVLGWGEGEDT